MPTPGITNCLWLMSKLLLLLLLLLLLPDKSCCSSERGIIAFSIGSKDISVAWMLFKPSHKGVGAFRFEVREDLLAEQDKEDHQPA